jgi:hypothetical protein
MNEIAPEYEALHSGDIGRVLGVVTGGADFLLAENSRITGCSISGQERTCETDSCASVRGGIATKSKLRSS